MINIEALNLVVGNFSLKDISMNIEAGECVALLGPSGAGKTLTLESILGLRRIRSGRIIADRKDITTLPTEKRGFSYMPQEGFVFPHLSVRENILYGLLVRGLDPGAPENSRRLDLLVENLAITSLLSRKSVSGMSGGEKHRLCLARALAVPSRLVLLDEPTVFLDEANRNLVMNTLNEMKRAYDVSILATLHHVDEAIRISDKIGFIKGGVLRQFGNLQDVFDRPVDKDVATYLDAGSVISGKVGRRNGSFYLEMGGVQLRCRFRNDLIIGETVSALIPYDAVKLWTDMPAPPNSFVATVESWNTDRFLLRMRLRVPGSGLVIGAILPKREPLPERVFVSVDEDRIWVLHEKVA